jgi:hypothetical protein
MVNLYFNRQLLLVLLLLLFMGCNDNPNGENPVDPTIKLVKNTSCKGLKSARLVAPSADSLSCVNYQYDQSTQKLTIQHINAAFNCCPDTLSCKISMSGDTIVISESEKKAGCKCNCLYDLQMEIVAIPAGKYQVRMAEPYCGSQKPLIFGIDLSKVKEGSFCVLRKQYPWGI